jgi:uroporphyrinogen decarboxylase
MRGGVDKFCVGKGREEIDRELDRIFPVVQDGGFIPHLDHMLPRCTFDDYCYYMERKTKMLASV